MIWSKGQNMILNVNKVPENDSFRRFCCMCTYQFELKCCKVSNFLQYTSDFLKKKNGFVLVVFFLFDTPYHTILILEFDVTCVG